MKGLPLLRKPGSGALNAVPAVSVAHALKVRSAAPGPSVPPANSVVTGLPVSPVAHARKVKSAAPGQTVARVETDRHVPALTALIPVARAAESAPPASVMLAMPSRAKTLKPCLRHPHRPPLKVPSRKLLRSWA